MNQIQKISSNNKKELISHQELYNTINFSTEASNYKKMCVPNSSGEVNYTGWKKHISETLNEYTVTALENYKQRIICYKRIEDTLMSVPETVIGFLFGGAAATAIFNDLSIGIIILLVAIVVGLPAYMFFLRKMHLKSEFYETLIDIVQEIIENKKNSNNNPKE